MKTQTSYLGIDVSKRTLHLGAPGKFLGEFENNLTGHGKLVKRLIRLKPACLVLEASGGYERQACDAMQDAGLPVAVAQPGCVRYFAKSIKVLAKTDKIDAMVIARFAEATRPTPSPRTPENIRKFRALCDRRTQVVEDRVREGNRLETCADPDMAQHIRDHLQQLREMEKDLDRKIHAMLQSEDELQSKMQIMTEQKGIGVQIASTLLAHLPELGTLSRQQVAAMAGIAPYPRESGAWKGKRRIYGGRAAVRTAMYMAAKVASRWCPVIREFYLRLRDNGKSYKQALIACARKMLIRLNTLLKQANPNIPAPDPTQTT